MATRRTTIRRLGNENAAQPTRPASTLNSRASQQQNKGWVAPDSTHLESKPAVAKSRFGTASTAVRDQARGPILANKTTNKTAANAQLLSQQDDAGPSKIGAGVRKREASEPLRHKIPKIHVQPASTATDSVAEEEIVPPAERPIKPLRRPSTKQDIASKTTLARRGVRETESASLIPARKTTLLREKTSSQIQQAAPTSALQDEEEEISQPKRIRLASPEESQVEALPKDYGWQDLDDGDEEDPTMVSEYVCEIYDYLKRLEVTTLPDPRYMDHQNEISWRMRSILIDWVIETHMKFRLLPETVFLAVNLIDRVCMARDITVVKYQLLGAACLFLAAKYEEIIVPSVSNFLVMTDSGYDVEEFLIAERFILGLVGWDISYPNPINFLRRISKADDYDLTSRTVAKFLMEISIVDRALVGELPSKIAAAACWLARKILARGPWDANLVHYSTYSEDEVLPCAQLMLNYVVKVVHTGTELEHPSFIRKYSSRKLLKASLVVRNWVQERYLDSFKARQTIKDYQSSQLLVTDAGQECRLFEVVLEELAATLS